ncbi:hypothetical protein WAI453_000889 [Rhynchosporium graminicola]
MVGKRMRKRREQVSQVNEETDEDIFLPLLRDRGRSSGCKSMRVYLKPQVRSGMEAEPERKFLSHTKSQKTAFMRRE